jgi:hypothetical protein
VEGEMSAQGGLKKAFPALSSSAVAPWHDLRWIIVLPLLLAGDIIVATLAWFAVSLVLPS